MLGLRTQETRKTDHFIEYVQKFAAEKNSVFFVFCSEGKECETDEFLVEDLSGWLIPSDKVEEFEKLYHEWVDLDGWADYFLFAEWSGDKDNPIIEFKEY